MSDWTNSDLATTVALLAFIGFFFWINPIIGVAVVICTLIAVAHQEGQRKGRNS